jgi:hypothetical protein
MELKRLGNVQRLASRSFSWLLGATLLFNSPGCRLRQLEPSSDETPTPQTPNPRPALPAELGTPAAAAGRSQGVPAVLIAMGFGPLGLEGVRSAQKEAAAVLSAMGSKPDPWAGLSVPLGDLERRRWPPARTTSQLAVDLHLAERGRATLERRPTQPLITTALVALGYESANPSATDPLDYDWSPLHGPSLALARSAAGELALVWSNSGQSASTFQHAQQVNDTAAIAVLCSCAAPRDLNRDLLHLSQVADAPAELARQVRALAEELRVASSEGHGYAVLALSQRGLSVEASELLVYGTAGSSQLEPVASQPTPDLEYEHSDAGVDAATPHSPSTSESTGAGLVGPPARPPARLAPDPTVNPSASTSAAVPQTYPHSSATASSAPAIAAPQATP